MPHPAFARCPFSRAWPVFPAICQAPPIGPTSVRQYFIQPECIPNCAHPQSLKVKLERELDLSRTVPGAGDHPKVLGVTKVRMRRVVETRRIGQVKEFGPKLEMGILRCVDVLEE